MKTLIETYRGFEIHFDTEQEVFFLFSDSHDDQNTKKSYASAKKYVDDFILLNVGFKPLTIISKPGYNGGKIITLTGIRKDKRFTFERDGKKEQLSDYNESDYVVFDPLVHPDYFKELEDLKKIVESAQEAVNAKEKEFTGVTLKSIKHQYAV